MKAKEEIIGLVQQALNLRSEISEFTNSQQREIIQRQIAACENHIKSHISNLYCISEKHQCLIEGINNGAD